MNYNGLYQPDIDDIPLNTRTDKEYYIRAARKAKLKKWWDDDKPYRNDFFRMVRLGFAVFAIFIVITVIGGLISSNSTTSNTSGGQMIYIEQQKDGHWYTDSGTRADKWSPWPWMN